MRGCSLHPTAWMCAGRRHWRDTLNVLAYGLTFDEASMVWGCAPSTVHGIVHHGVEALEQALYGEVVWPEGDNHATYVGPCSSDAPCIQSPITSVSRQFLCLKSFGMAQVCS